MSVSCRQPQISALLTRKYGTVILIIIQLYSGVLYDRRTCCKHRWKDLLSCVSPAVPCLVLLTHTSKRDRRRAAPVAVLVSRECLGWLACYEDTSLAAAVLVFGVRAVLYEITPSYQNIVVRQYLSLDSGRLFFRIIRTP
jgi:hypothetical protein